jgi:hypothetical protein
VARRDGAAADLVFATPLFGTIAQIERLSLADEAVFMLAASNGPVSSLISDGLDVYFSDDDGAKSVPLSGGSVQTLTSQKGTLGLAGSNVLIASGGGLSALVHGPELDVVYTMPKTGGALTTLASDQTAAQFPMACGTDICWISAFGGTGPGGYPAGEGDIVRWSAALSAHSLVLDPLLYPPVAMVFDGSYFFVLNGADAATEGQVNRVSVAGGGPFPVGRADAIAVAGGCLFAIDEFDGLYSQPASYTP